MHRVVLKTQLQTGSLYFVPGNPLPFSRRYPPEREILARYWWTMRDANKLVWLNRRDLNETTTANRATID